MTAPTVRVYRDVLIRALDAVSPAVARSKDDLPVLRGVRITADERVTIEARNSELRLWARVFDQIAERRPASAVIHARTLRTVLRRGLPDGIVTLTLDPERPSVSAGSTTVWLEGLPVDAWPELWLPKEAGPKAEIVSLTAADVAAIRRVAVAASCDWSRPILRSICLADGYAAATDSYRLAAARISARPSRPLLLPLDAVRVLPDDAVDLTVDGDFASWGTAVAGGTTALQPGDFPHWRQLMPDPAAAPLVLDRAAFLAAVLRAEATLSVLDPSGAVPLLVIPVAGGIRLGARIGSRDIFADESLDLPAPGIEPFALNPRFLAEALRSHQGERVRLSMRDPIRPLLLTDDTDDVEAFRTLMMPVRVDAFASARKAS